MGRGNSMVRRWDLGVGQAGRSCGEGLGVWGREEPTIGKVYVVINGTCQSSLVQSNQNPPPPPPRPNINYWNMVRHFTFQASENIPHMHHIPTLTLVNLIASTH